ncbi:MAG: tRNA-dihydrouridine synthase family protein, partial [Lachnospiraceae bacterium]|nr:tRNA-dihydrouridine synthase family protein [Lachnospiraceae bacterium]
LVANQTHHFKKRELKEVSPPEQGLVPQILTGSSADFVWAARHLAGLGYTEVNLNCGCPYPTVFTKGKGSGMLADPVRLDRFLSEIFSEPDMPAVSVKTRVGVSDPAEAGRLAEIYAKYPICEITIHPRVRDDYYEGELKTEALKEMKKILSGPVCFNGDIRTPEDTERIPAEFPDTEAVMIGRGLIEDPELAEKVREREAGKDHADTAGNGTDNRRLAAFLDELWDAYSEVLYGERDVLFKMKEIWYYLGRRFPERERALLDIKKAKHREDYREAVSTVLDT